MFTPSPYRVASLVLAAALLAAAGLRVGQRGERHDYRAEPGDAVDGPRDGGLPNSTALPCEPAAELGRSTS